MKTKKIAIVVMLLLSTASVLAAPVGNVLAVAGNVVVQRAGQEIPLTRGAGLENGDVLQVGSASVLQIRFIDESIVSLRANSTFKIEDFRYTQNIAEDRSIFALLKGGLRTITGLIGKRNPEHYAVKNSIATIGIRGTHFSLVSCDAAAPCKNPDDTDAPAGLYGGVTDGRIAVSNEAGEFEFGQQEYFRVVSPAAAPSRLLAPPPFLSAGFESAIRSRDQNDEPATVAIEGVSEPRNTSPLVASSPQLTALKSQMSALPEVMGTVFAPSEIPAVISQASGSGRSPITAGNGIGPTTVSSLTLVQSVTNPKNIGQHAVEYHDIDSVVWDSQGYKSASCGTNCFVNRNQARSAERGADGGVLEWGRWVGGPTAAGGWGSDLTFNETQGWHYVGGVSTAASDMPTTGAAISYMLLGATAPTFGDGLGNRLGIGSVKSSSATVNFIAGTLAAEWAIEFTGGNEYKLLLPSASFSGSSINGSGSLSQTSGSTDVCSGSSCNATFKGFFAGAEAKYLALGYDVDTSATNLNGVSVYTAQVPDEVQTPLPIPEPQPQPQPSEPPPAAPAPSSSLSSLDISTGSSSFALVSSGSPSSNGQTMATQGVSWSFKGTKYEKASDLAAALSTAGANVLNDHGPDGGYVAWDQVSHIAFGPIFEGLPSSGTATYSLRAASIPSDSLGRQGSFSAVPIILNFANRTLSTGGSMGIEFSANTSTGSTAFQLSASNVSAGSFLEDGMLHVPMNVSCTGCTAEATGHLQGALMAEAGLGVILQADGTVLTNGVSSPLTSKVAAIYYSSELADGVTGTTEGIRHVEAYASVSGDRNVISENFELTMEQVLVNKTAKGGYQTVTNIPGGESFYWAVQDQGTGNTGHHQAWGYAPISLPSSGTATYNLYSHSSPTDNFGRSGTLGSASMTVNFTDRTMTANTESGISLQFPSSGFLPVTTYKMSISNVPINNTTQAVPTICSGCLTSGVEGAVNLSFAGNNGQAVLGALAVQGNISSLGVDGGVNSQPHVGAATAVWARPIP
jgi:hypothetical protein